MKQSDDAAAPAVDQTSGKYLQHLHELVSLASQRVAELVLQGGDTSHAEQLLSAINELREADRRLILALRVSSRSPEQEKEKEKDFARTHVHDDSGTASAVSVPLGAVEKRYWACGASAMGSPQLPPICPEHGPSCDLVCEHGTAMDVHCCGCHSGFLFDSRKCICF